MINQNENRIEIDIIEGGKRFFQNHTSDFDVLYSSMPDQNPFYSDFVSKNFCYPENSYFNSLFGKVSFGFFKFTENNYYFTQIQRRKENDLYPNITFTRPFNQIRISFINKTKLDKCIKNQIAIFLDLVYKNNRNFLLNDYGNSNNFLQENQNKIVAHPLNYYNQYFSDEINNTIDELGKRISNIILIDLIKEKRKTYFISVESLIENFKLNIEKSIEFKSLLINRIQSITSQDFRFLTYAFDYISEQYVDILLFDYNKLSTSYKHDYEILQCDSILEKKVSFFFSNLLKNEYFLQIEDKRSFWKEINNDNDLLTIYENFNNLSNNIVEAFSNPNFNSFMLPLIKKNPKLLSQFYRQLRANDLQKIMDNNKEFFNYILNYTTNIDNSLSNRDLQFFLKAFSSIPLTEQIVDLYFSFFFNDEKGSKITREYIFNQVFNIIQNFEKEFLIKYIDHLGINNFREKFLPICLNKIENIDWWFIQSWIPREFDSYPDDIVLILKLYKNIPLKNGIISKSKILKIIFSSEPPSLYKILYKQDIHNLQLVCSLLRYLFTNNKNINSSDLEWLINCFIQYPAKSDNNDILSFLDKSNLWDTFFFHLNIDQQKMLVSQIHQFCKNTISTQTNKQNYHKSLLLAIFKSIETNAELFQKILDSDVILFYFNMEEIKSLFRTVIGSPNYEDRLLTEQVHFLKIISSLKIESIYFNKTYISLFSQILHTKKEDINTGENPTEYFYLLAILIINNMNNPSIRDLFSLFLKIKGLNYDSDIFRKFNNEQLVQLAGIFNKPQKDMDSNIEKISYYLHQEMKRRKILNNKGKEKNNKIQNQNINKHASLSNKFTSYIFFILFVVILVFIFSFFLPNLLTY